ncbi:hypothetical protein PVA38_12270 [Streptococcus pneumoniae D39]|nr:hypothetical protein PVA38_12270 [Streptococcus pneumoniae D39]
MKRSEVLSKLVAVLISGFCFLVPLVVGCYFVTVSYTHLTLPTKLEV